MKRKVWGIVLTTMLSVSVLIGCSSNETKEEDTTKVIEEEDTKEETSSEETSSDKKDKEEKNKEDAITVLNRALAKTNKETSYAGSMSIFMSMPLGDETISMDMTSDFIFNNADDSTKIEAVTSVNSIMNNESYLETMYVKDGNVYRIDTYGEKKMSVGSANEVISTKNTLTKISDNSIESGTLETRDGQKIISIELNEQGVRDEVMNELASTLSAIGVDEESMVVEDYLIEYTLSNDNYIQMQFISYSLQFEIDGKMDTLEVRNVVKYTSFGEQVIEFPDFSEYQQI